jgi:hypothetical protein
MCRRSAEYANKPHNAAKAWTFVRNAAFRATPHHSTPRRTTPHLCRMTPHLCHSCCGRFRTKQLGQANLLHKTIHLSAATVDSVWHLCSKVFKFMDIIPHLKCGLPHLKCRLSMKILWHFHGQSRSGVNCGVRH